MSAVIETAVPDEGLFMRLRRWNGRQELFAAKKRLALYRRLQRFAARGFDVKVPLEHMLLRAREKNRDSALILEELVRGINNGARFSTLLGDMVPPSERMAISSGEETGKMDDGFGMAAYIVEAGSSLKSAVWGSLAYPVVLMLVFLALLGFVSVILMPTLATLYAVEKWPAISKALYYISTFVKSYGLITLGLLVVGAIVSIKSLPVWCSGWRAKFDRRLPPWSIYREVQSGLLLVTLSSVVKSGSPFDEALRRLKRVASPWLEQHLEEMMRGVAEGRRTAHAMNTGIFSDDVMDDLLAYDQAGDLSDSITTIGKDSVELVIARIKAIAQAGSGVLMVMVGAGLVWSWGSFILVFMAMRAANTF